MKIRTDFISNSSSCSFIVKISDNNELEQFRKIMPMLTKDYRANVFASCTPQTWEQVDVTNNPERIDVNDWLYVDLGEDTLENIDKIQDVEVEIDNLPVKLKVFRDTLAHYTFGEDLSEDER